MYSKYKVIFTYRTVKFLEWSRSHHKYSTNCHKWKEATSDLQSKSFTKVPKKLN